MGSGRSQRHMEDNPAIHVNRVGVPKPDIAVALGILDALLAEIAVIDGKGTIVLANAAWSRFAKENAANRGLISGVGINYLDVCRSASGSGSEGAQEVLAGLEDVLSGNSQQFCFEYPCHSPTQRRWFLKGGDFWLLCCGSAAKTCGGSARHRKSLGRIVVPLIGDFAGGIDQLRAFCGQMTAPLEFRVRLVRP